MKYILAIIITISVVYTGYKLTKKTCDLIDRLFDYLEEKRRKER